MKSTLLFVFHSTVKHILSFSFSLHLLKKSIVSWQTEQTYQLHNKTRGFKTFWIGFFFKKEAKISNSKFSCSTHFQAKRKQCRNTSFCDDVKKTICSACLQEHGTCLIWWVGKKDRLRAKKTLQTNNTLKLTLYSCWNNTWKNVKFVVCFPEKKQFFTHITMNGNNGLITPTQINKYMFVLNRFK